MGCDTKTGHSDFNVAEMNTIRRLYNPIQQYAWGSPTAIPELLGQPNPGGAPWAELWMGAHPKAPSLVETDTGWTSLEALIRDDPVAMLGNGVARRFGGRLPYLFKVLAAAAPLSIQAHPDKRQAEHGFATENRFGIPMDAPRRNYKDDNHKPECICALRPFLALCGFRRVSDIVRYMEPLPVPELAGPMADLRRHPDREGLKTFFKHLMTAESNDQRRMVQGVVDGSADRGSTDPAYEWVGRLHTAYPGDIGVLAPLLLNLTRLTPGQALFLPAGELHAYLEGVGIELMANSDNVLRGGLTPKHVDVPGLMSVLSFNERDLHILEPRAISDVEWGYPTPAAEFHLSTLHLRGDDRSWVFDNPGLQILLCLEGAASFSVPGRRGVCQVEKGGAVIVPAGVPVYEIRGGADLVKASTLPAEADGIDHPTGSR